LRYGLVINGAGDLFDGLQAGFDAADSSVTQNPDTGVYSANDEIAIHGITPGSTPTSGSTPHDNTSRDVTNVARVGTALAALGTTTALAIYQGLSAADRAKATANNAADLSRLSNSAGFSTNSAAQQEYAQRLAFQQAIQRQNASSSLQNPMMLYWIGGVLLLGIGAYVVLGR
jgi:hypothetical protein